MIGNDIVDLGDPDVDPRATHPRFDARVFTAAERAALAASAAPQRLRWCLWAAKEAAYKAARRLDGSVVFSPSRFVVGLDATGTRGVVRHPVGAYRLVIEDDPAYVHVIALHSATRRPDNPARFVSAVGAAGIDPSSAVRQLAIRGISAALGEDPAAFAITRRGRVPQLARHGVPAPVRLSLSHHGRFVAFAGSLLDPGAPA